MQAMQALGYAPDDQVRFAFSYLSMDVLKVCRLVAAHISLRPAHRRMLVASDVSMCWHVHRRSLRRTTPTPSSA